MQLFFNCTSKRNVPALKISIQKFCFQMWSDKRLDLDKNCRRNNIFLLSEKKIRSLTSWLINIYKLLIVLFFLWNRNPDDRLNPLFTTKSSKQKGKEDSNIKLPNYIRCKIVSKLLLTHSAFWTGLKLWRPFGNFLGKQSNILCATAFVLHRNNHVKGFS